MTNTIEITTSQFRQEQKKYFDMAMKGIKVLVYRGTELFEITPVKKQWNPDTKTLKQIEKSRKQINEGLCTTVRNRAELDEFLDTL